MKKLLILAALCANIAQASFKSYFSPANFGNNYVKPIQTFHGEFYKLQFKVSDSILKKAKLETAKLEKLSPTSCYIATFVLGNLFCRFNIFENALGVLLRNHASTFLGLASALYAIEQRSKKSGTAADAPAADAPAADASDSISETGKSTDTVSDDSNTSYILNSNNLVIVGNMYASILACKAITFAAKKLIKNIKPVGFAAGSLYATKIANDFATARQFTTTQRLLLTGSVGLTSLGLIARYGE
jgi:hypothetical protein